VAERLSFRPAIRRRDQGAQKELRLYEASSRETLAQAATCYHSQSRVPSHGQEDLRDALQPAVLIQKDWPAVVLPMFYCVHGS